MPLSLSINTIADPDGHQPALRLKGDWVVIAISDDAVVGVGEASHSGDDHACENRINQLFKEYIHDFHFDLPAIRALEIGIFSHTDDFVTATAISALNQALYDLLATQQGIPLWKLFSASPKRKTLPFYATINRALRSRTPSDYLRVCRSVRDHHISAIKCAPFEKVIPGMPPSEQVAAAQTGLSILNAIHDHFPECSMRVDFHNRFHLSAFLEILPRLEDLDLVWIEEPCMHPQDFSTIRSATRIPLAAGELFFGTEEFIRLMDGQLVDVIMPDIKHVGGTGPLIAVCREAEKRGVGVSPHNPSGPVACLAALQASAASTAITSIETVYLSSGGIPLMDHVINGNSLKIPQ
jgi:galactonate dehydratase